ncbi:A-kinase anchoring protein 7 isoform X5 [Tachyglossus aculeatus]|uniref:A-kinase anchoring protein 7 isoform X5 n=1 Tax=Tachyglossus aculeatus TaxID=9261 RepID=UPI0018F501BB|nr:A-kinase anchoring protein 7 isoform X5 [Tachyglossus aculeatus]
MGQLCCFPFSRDEEKISKSPVYIVDLIEKALRRETTALFSKVKQIKELLSQPEIRAKIKREVLDARLSNSSNQEKSH